MSHQSTIVVISEAEFLKMREEIKELKQTLREQTQCLDALLSIARKNQKEWYTASEAGDLLGRSAQTIRLWGKQGKVQRKLIAGTYFFNIKT